MPQLNPANLPVSPVAKAMEAIRAKLDSAQGAIGKLNRSVKFGADSILKDAIEQRQLETAAPYIRIEYATQRGRMNGTGGVLFSRVTVTLFFVYYLQGYTPPNPLPVYFAAERDAHIRWNIEFLKDQRVKPNNTIGFTDAEHCDDAGRRYWWWPDGEQDVQWEHEQALKLLGITIPVGAAQSFTCSAVTFDIMVMNHATFGGDPIPIPNMPIYVDATNDVTMLTGRTYRANDPDDPVLFSLPITANYGDAPITILGFGAGGWRVVQRIGEQITISGSTNATTAGTAGFLESINTNDSCFITPMGGGVYAATVLGCQFG